MTISEQADDRGVLRVPPRTIPVPNSISAEASAVLRAAELFGIPFPPLEDSDAWRGLAEVADASLLPSLEAGVSEIKAEVYEIEIGGVAVYRIVPEAETSDRPRRVLLEFHGGALFMGGGLCCRAMGKRMASAVGAETWSVDYRMPPDHPYPAALDDAMTVFESLLSQYRPQEIIVGGGSAGGNIAAALILRARDEGLPLPAAALLLTPEVDLTESGDSFQTNLGVDSVLAQHLAPANELYGGGHDLTDPYLSPIFADFSKGFPPTFLQTGTRDLFLSNTVRMHRALRAAHIPVDLHVFEAMPHGGFGDTPEDLELQREIRRFVDEQWARSTSSP